MEPIAIGTTSIVATRGDISAEDVDAVVNAANNHLQLGAGVAGAIDRRGGPAIQRECDAWIEKHGLLPDDGAAVTTAGDMPARSIIHVAGPRTIDPSHLAAAVTAALAATQSSECRSVAIPAISAGTFGYPPDQAVAVIVEAATTWVTGHPDALDEVRFVGYDDEIRALFAGAIERFA